MVFSQTDNRKYTSRQKAAGRLFVAALLVTAVMLVGQSCSSTPKIIKPSKSGWNLKKQVCITRFEDNKRFDDAYLEKPFQDQLQDALLTNCKNPIFIVPGQKEFPAAFETLPLLPSGFKDNMAISEIGRENGFNAVVTGVISDVRQKNEISWMTGDRSYLQVTINAEIYDTQTHAKLLDKTYLHEVEVDVDKATASEKETEYFDIIAIEKVLKTIVAEMRADICDAVSFIPWLGFIIAGEGDTVTISAGKRVGLKVGTHLNIYQNDQILTGYTGDRYRVPGPLIGELKITSVSENQSTAVLVQGTGAVAGNSVSLK